MSPRLSSSSAAGEGWLLSRLGAFPIRRSESDEDAIETARLVVERGGAVCIFPEGTRIRTGSLAAPRRGVGRLALQTGAPVIPAAVLGTEHVRRGWRIRPRKVKVRLGRAMTFPRAGRSLAGAGRKRDTRGSGPTSSCNGKTSAACRRCAAPP